MTWLHLFGMLLILFTAMLTVVGGIVVVVAFAKGRSRVAIIVSSVLVAWCALHLIFVGAVAAGAPARRLPPGEVKHFCGFYLDCHIGAAVVGRRRVGSLEIVAVEISSSARAATLSPYGLTARLVDQSGRVYPVFDAGQRAYEDAHGGRVPLEQAIPPGGSYRRNLVFEVPANAPGLALDLRERGFPDDWIEFFLAGDDDSFLHEPVLLSLPPVGL